MAKKKKSNNDEGGGFAKMLATTVVLGIVFSAGLITGQRLLRAQARAPMVSLSTTRAAPQQADPGEEAKPSLRTTFSFYEHLTGQAEASPPPAEEQPEADEPASPQAPAEEPVEEAPQEPAEEEPADEVAADPVNDEPAPEAEQEPPPSQKADKPMAEILDEVVDSLSEDDESTPSDNKTDTALPARYTLQVSSHPDRSSAEREMGRLTNMGVEPHVVVVNVPGKGELWRVRVGKFHSMDEARDFQGSIKSKRGVAGFVTPL